MSIRVSCATWQLSRQVMLAASPEKNRHRKSDDCSEANPPGKFYGWMRGGFDVSNIAKQSRDRIQEVAQNRDDDKAGNHGDEVAAIIAARFCEHAGQENAEHRTVSVAINSEYNRNDADVRQHDHEIGCGRCDHDH